MNWGNIEKTWKEFAESNGAEFYYSERNLFHGIICSYKLEIEDDLGHTRFHGTLWKEQNGQNRYKTKIWTKLNSKRDLKNFEVNVNGLGNIFSWTKQKPLGKDFQKEFKKIGGKKMSLKDGLLKLEMRQVLSSKKSFDGIMELIKKVKTCS